MDNESTHYEKKLMIEVCKYVAVRGEQKKARNSKIASDVFLSRERRRIS